MKNGRYELTIVYGTAVINICLKFLTENDTKSVTMLEPRCLAAHSYATGMPIDLAFKPTFKSDDDWTMGYIQM